MTASQFVPLMISTAGLIIAAFSVNKKNKNIMILAFILWLIIFFFTISKVMMR